MGGLSPFFVPLLPQQGQRVTICHLSLDSSTCIPYRLDPGAGLLRLSIAGPWATQLLSRVGGASCAMRDIVAASVTAC